MEPAPIVLTPTIHPEDQARADFYALLARLYAAEPDAALLKSIAAADELRVDEGNAEGEALAEAWRKLIAASAVMDAEAAAAEYLDLFVGVGASEVSPHASAYEKVPGRQPLVEVRAALARLGLSRQPGNIALRRPSGRGPGDHARADHRRGRVRLVHRRRPARLLCRTRRSVGHIMLRCNIRARYCQLLQTRCTIDQSVHGD